MRNFANPIVFTNLELTLQRLLDGLQQGYTHVTSGQVNPTKAMKLAVKFDIQYQVFADKNLRLRRKRNNQGNAKWVCYYKDDIIYWWLMVSPKKNGDHLAHTTEDLVDCGIGGNNLKFNDFELVVLPYSKPTKPKPAKYKARSKPTRRTWRLTKKAYESFRVRIIDDVRSRNPNKLIRIIQALYSMPGYGEIRSQVGKLVSLYSAEVKRANLTNAPKPLDKLSYTRRRANNGVRLGVLADNYQLTIRQDAV